MSVPLVSASVRAAYQAEALADKAEEFLSASAKAGGAVPELAVPGALVGIGYALLALRKQVEAATCDLTDSATFVAEQVTTAATVVTDALSHLQQTATADCEPLHMAVFTGAGVIA